MASPWLADEILLVGCELGSAAGREVTRIFFDEGLERHFAAHGYALASLLTPEEAKAALADLLAIQRHKPREAENRQASGFYASLLDNDLDYKHEIFKNIHARLAPRINRIVDGYKVLTASFLEKPAGCGEVHLHCDYTMSADAGDVNLNFWCPLVDSDDSNGALRLVSGSHRLVRQINTAGTRDWFSSCKEALKARSRTFRLRAGEALVFDSTMPHWSRSNSSASSRFAVSLLCLQLDSIPALYRPLNTPSGPMLELLDMGDEGFYQHTMEDLLAGTASRKRLGLVSNVNHSFSIAEIDRLMAEASRSRGACPDRSSRNWMTWARTMLGRRCPSSSKLG